MKYIVIKRNIGQLVVSSLPHEHDDFAKAKAEAERLASLNPGASFEVFAAMSSSKAKSVETTMLIPSSISLSEWHRHAPFA